jgi:hypothetical protein
MSENFGKVDIEHLTFPATMRVDWIRVYQPKDAINIGCDPQNFPTAAYINQCAIPALLLTVFRGWLITSADTFPLTRTLILQLGGTILTSHSRRASS